MVELQSKVRRLAENTYYLFDGTEKVVFRANVFFGGYILQNSYKKNFRLVNLVANQMIDVNYY